MLSLSKLLGSALALLILNFSLSFHNFWPTPWIRLKPELSVEAAVIVLFITLHSAYLGHLSARTRSASAALLLALVFGRYLEVTAPALYGRPINLYWDTEHLPRVFMMIVESSESWTVAVGTLASIFCIIVLFFGFSWAINILSVTTTSRVPRVYLASLAAVVLALYAAGMSSHRITSERLFSIPVSWTYARQIAFVHDALVGEVITDGPTTNPEQRSDLGKLKGRDIYLIFLESYGKTVFGDNTHAQSLIPSFNNLRASANEHGWQAVSAFYESPTFGGASWLSHATLMTGAWVIEQNQYQLLLTSDKRTLVQHFKKAGFRAAALMPGLRMAWPEGDFYDYDKIWDADSLEYEGPGFGWWKIPDQYSLARFYNEEAAINDRRPLFGFFATITSHMPFTPTPPYQHDWTRLLSPTPYDEAITPLADNAPLDWNNLGPAYAKAIEYELHLLRDFLSITAHQEPLIIALGDHQPPSIVAGTGAPWLVPVHIFAREMELLEPFESSGFQKGLRPNGPALGRLDQLHGLILRALDSNWQITHRE